MFFVQISKYYDFLGRLRKSRWIFRSIRRIIIWRQGLQANVLRGSAQGLGAKMRMAQKKEKR